MSAEPSPSWPPDTAGSDRSGTGSRDAPSLPRSSGEATSIQDALDRLVLEAMVPASAGLATLYALVSATSFLIFDPGISLPAAVVYGASALALASLRQILLRETPEPKLAHPVGALVAGVVLLNSILLMAMTGQARHTIELVLLILAISAVFLDVGWFASVLALIFAAWLWTAVTVPLQPSTIYPGISLVIAAVLSSAILAVRRRTLGEIEGLRFKDRLHHLELETALSRTEAARAGEQEAREAMEEAMRGLAESRSRFRRLAEATLDGIVVHEDGRILDASTRVAEIVLRPLDQLVGSRLGDLVEEEDRRDLRAFLEADSREATAQEVMGLRGDGSTFPMEIRTARRGVDDDTGEDRRGVIVLRDVTETHQAEEMLRRAMEEAQANDRAKTAFLAKMSHELRTPLNSVIGFANILRKNSHDHLNERDLSFLDRILSNGEHLLELIEDVLDLSQLESDRVDVRVETVRLPAIVDAAVEGIRVAADGKDLSLEVETPDDLEPLETDPDRLRQILVHLLDNAVRFTEEGRVVVRVLADGETGRPVRLDVIDTGIGIPADRLDPIFEAFKQAEEGTGRRFGGTGLGLTISQRIAQILGFRLTVESREGEGSTFSIHF